MGDTPNLGLPELTEGQASGEITHNEALNRLDSLVMGGIKDRDLSDPPESPSNGDRYIVKTAGVNAWEGHNEELAIYYDGWIFIPPKQGWRLWVDDEYIMILYDGTVWTNANIFNRRKESTEVVSSGSTGTTYQNDNDLFFPMRPYEIWQCRAMLVIQDASAGQVAGFKFKWTIPAVAELSGTYQQFEDEVGLVKAGALADSAGKVLTLPDGNAHHVLMEFMVINDATPGNLQLEWAQNAEDASSVRVFGQANYSSYLYGIRAGYGVPLT